MIGDEPGDGVCSRAGCRAPALWIVEWRNPRIHAADRRKRWGACDEHVEFLRGFLVARDFPVEVRPLSTVGGVGGVGGVAGRAR